MIDRKSGAMSFFYACTLILVYATENRQSPSILRIIHLWSTKTLVGKMASELSVSKLLLKHVASNKKLISSRTSVDWYNFIRDVCAQHFISHPEVIEVKIDESKFGKRKCNRGRKTDGHWVFGGIERVSGECFLVKVQQRDAGTLLPLIAALVASY